MRELAVEIERKPYVAAPARKRVRGTRLNLTTYQGDTEETAAGERYAPLTLDSERTALVLGGASCLWRDVAVLETLVGEPWPGIVIAVNDVGCTWPRKLDHWVTIHPDKFKVYTGNRSVPPKCGHPRHHGWIDCRRQNGHPDGYLLWSEREKGPNMPLMDRVCRQWASGSSGLLAVAVAYQLGCARVVLCGTPMDDRPHFRESVVHDPRTRWNSVRSHRGAWQSNLTRLRERTRSLSGWTRDVLGAPTPEWLANLEARRLE